MWPETPTELVLILDTESAENKTCTASPGNVLNPLARVKILVQYLPESQTSSEISSLAVTPANTGGLDT